MSYFDELREFYSAQPNEVTIETQAVCNARCTFCPYPTLERLGTKMPTDLIYRLIDEMAEWEHPFFFSPFKVSDPLLDKRIFDICRRFNERVPGSALRMFTNGSALTDRNADGVAELKNVAHLWVSLNTHRPKEYEALMGLDFERTAANLDRLHAREFPHPVVVSRVGNDPDFAKYVKWRWPKFQVAMIKRDSWIDFTHADSDEIPDAPCGRWWELNIAANGAESLCCMDSKAAHGWGNAHEQTLLEMYNHPTRKRWRDLLISRLDAGFPCSTCSY